MSDEKNPPRPLSGHPFQGEGITRRQFVQTAATGAVSALTLGALLSACKSETGGATAEKQGEQKAAELDCTDVSALNEGEKKTRESLQYVDKSPHAGKTCANCQLFQPPAGGTGCGGCTVVKGPINPAGYCNSWVQKQPA